MGKSTRYQIRILVVALSGILCGYGHLSAETGVSPYPLIRELTNRDAVFSQLQKDIEAYYAREAAGMNVQSISLYGYRTQKGESLFSLASRCNLPYESIALLNRINRPGLIAEGTFLLIPNTPGIFVAALPNTDLEYLITSWRTAKENSVKVKVLRNGIEEEFTFLPGERFHPIERAFFLGILFRFPIPKGKISSYFGIRKNPFTGNHGFHNGIDISAPLGTEVIAAREGTVKTVGYDAVYGNYVILKHENDYETLYGHLSESLVQLNQQVNSGMILGKVGSTGLSTGPHLHFEIRRLGESKDPIPLLPGERR
ncbi:MAG TPA: M23 family metallopeptidase [Spirochaetia bacterium]|nr:M23 family metallopeptidase [Spirochaetia bacterium]